MREISSPKIETTQMSVDGQMDRENVVHPCSGMVFSHEKEQNTDTCYRHKRLRVADSVYEKCPEEANPQRQKVD